MPPGSRVFELKNLEKLCENLTKFKFFQPVAQWPSWSFIVSKKWVYTYRETVPEVLPAHIFKMMSVSVDNI